MRPTTKRRVIVLATAAVLGSLALGGIYEVRQYQINEQTLEYRKEGMDAFKHGDFARALMPLSKYIEHRQNDAEALFAFGKARSRVEAPNNRNLSEAISYYRRGLELQPDNMDAKHQLLDLYSGTGYNAEAITLADELLRQDPKDTSALRAKAKALASRKQFAEALETSKKLNELAPEDIEGQGLTLYLMSPWCLNDDAKNILARANKNLKAHPNDPRFVLLLGLAYHCALDDANAKAQYLKAAANPPADPEFVKFCTQLMDEVGLFDKSQELLERAADADGKDPRMLRMLIQRLWQNGRYPQVVERLKDLDPSTTTSDSHLLAYRAFSLYQLQRDQEAKPIIEALAGRRDDDVALAWAKALRARFENPDGNPREKIQQYQGALVRDPGNSVIRYMMGESYARLGETELALQAWSQVIKDVPSWPTPRVQVAYLLASTGRTQTAVEQALAAYNSSQNLGSAIGFVVALATELDSGNNPPSAKRVLELAGEIQKKVPGEPQTLPIYVSLLARTGDSAKACEVIKDAIAKSYPIGTDAWLRLASVSHARKLGLDQEILDHTAKKYGMTPKLALATAMLSDANDSQAALDSLASKADQATSDQASWHLVVAQFREYLHDPAAHEGWVKLGDQFPQDLGVQSAIIDLPDSSSAWADRAFIERTIQRLHALTGDQGFHWQLARCRWLLTSPDRERDSAEAVVTLSDIVRGSPGLVIPRLYLAKAMENVHNTSAAVEQLRAAAEMDRDNAAIALDLVRLLQADGKFTDAKVYLDRAAQVAGDGATRRRVAMDYARQGNLDAAIAMLTNGSSIENDEESAALLADLYRRKGDFDQAGKLYEKLAGADKPEASTLAEAADYFASHDQMDKAQHVIGRLSELKLPAGHREAILADFAEKHGSKADALKLLRQATAAAPTDPVLWRELAAMQMRQNQFDQAAATCDAALAKIPGNEDLASLKNQAMALRMADGGKGTVDTDALIAELSKDPNNAAARDSLAAYNESLKNHDSPERAVLKLRRVADQYPRFLPVQTQVVRMYLQQGKTSEAIAVAARAMENFPNDPEPAGLATIVYASQGRWSDVLSAAETWRRRSLENPMQADVAIAGARLKLGQPSEAISVLKPYLDRAKQEPDKYNVVIGTYAEALIGDNREGEAMALLDPFLSRSAEWQISTIRLAQLVHGSAEEAKWIKHVAATIPADSLKAQYEVANAWYMMGIRFQNNAAVAKDAFTQANKAVEPLTKRMDTTATVNLLAGSIAENLSDADEAIADYRRALQLDPNQPVAQNNLAYLLLTKGQDLDEARQLAERAVAAAPADPNYYDTLAHVYDKAGKTDRAIAAFQKVLDLQPNNVHAMVPTIRLLNQEGQRQAARAMMSRLETLLQSNPALQTPDLDIQSLRQQAMN